MSIILELRGHYKHAGITLVHDNSEDVVVGNVFGIVKNLRRELVLWPWLSLVTGMPLNNQEPSSFLFWDSQSIPIGREEGPTKVDVVVEGSAALVFIEAKLGADASVSTTHDRERDQLTRNLDVGSRLAAELNKDFYVVYLTTDDAEPKELVATLRAKGPDSSRDNGHDLGAHLHWASWASIGDLLAELYISKQLDRTEASFSLDVLAYLVKKGLWTNRLPDQETFHSDKLLAPLMTANSAVYTRYKRRRTPDRTWRRTQWTESDLRDFMGSLNLERERALLKVIASHDGGVQQRAILEELPFINGWKGLQRIKSNINARCRGRGRAPILGIGHGPAGDRKVHEFDGDMGDLRAVAIEIARAFEIRSHLL
jgi:hypothetical protein